MKLKVMQSNLLPALTAATRAINARTTLPVLESVLLDAQDDTVVLTTTNLEIGYRIPVSAKVEKPGKVTVPAKDLLKIVKAASDLIEIECEDPSLAQPLVTVTSGFITRRIRGIDAEEFPNVDDVPALSTSLVIQATQLRDAINETVKFAGTTEARPILTGEHLALVGGKVTLTAANNFALGVAVIDGAEVIAGEFTDRGIVIPAVNLAQVAKVLAKSKPGEAVAVGFGAKNQVFFGFENGWRIVSRLIDGTYPNWQQVVPPKSRGATKVTVELAAMRELFDALNGDRHVKLTFGDDSINAYREADGEEFDASIPAVMAEYTGDMVWGVDPDYMRDVLSSTPGKTLTIELSSTLAPALIYPDDATSYVVMPVKLPSSMKVSA